MPRPRYADVRDTNESDIVDALRGIGCDVQVIGKPVDLLVGYRCKNFLIEVKAEGTYYKGTQEQRDFIREWRGQVRVVYTAEEAIKLVTEAYR